MSIDAGWSLLLVSFSWPLLLISSCSFVTLSSTAKYIATVDLLVILKLLLEAAKKLGVRSGASYLTLDVQAGLIRQTNFCFFKGMDPLIDIRNERQIPLLCTVCPDTPRFSDVSHLLTHIASKGHLHHETQTKLKSHQDLVAAIALQHYEQWYRDYGIETLLVERMKAKQVKEAARHRPSRGRPPNVPLSTMVKTIDMENVLHGLTLTKL